MQITDQVLLNSGFSIAEGLSFPFDIMPLFVYDTNQRISLTYGSLEDDTIFMLFLDDENNKTLMHTEDMFVRTTKEFNDALEKYHFDKITFKEP